MRPDLVACDFAALGHAGALSIYVKTPSNRFQCDRLLSLRFPIRFEVYISL
jgi:hypothetical protein